MDDKDKRELKIDDTVTIEGGSGVWRVTGFNASFGEVEINNLEGHTLTRHRSNISKLGSSLNSKD